MSHAPGHELLRNGDRMTRDEFHRAYEQTPEDYRAELIGGIVRIPRAATRRHGNLRSRLGMLLAMYECNTPGAEAGIHATLLLGNDSEPEPDAFLRILPEHGGQSRTSADDYIVGAPELVVEIAGDDRAMEFREKRADYARHGVREYLVASIGDGALSAFDLASNRELRCEADGIFRSHAFPGLWIDVQGVFVGNYEQMMAALRCGVESREHAGFVRRVALAKGKPNGGDPDERHR